MRVLSVIVAAFGLALTLPLPAYAQDSAAQKSGAADKAGTSKGSDGAAKKSKEKTESKPASEEKAAQKEGGSQRAAGADDDAGAENAQVQDDANDNTGRTLAERIQAVSRRVFIKRYRFEVTPLVGFSLNDAFYQRINGGARFSFHVLESLAIDVGGAFNPVGLPLPTVTFLRESANQQGVVTPPFWGYVDGGLTFAPIYGKFSLMSEMVIHFDAYFSAGVGLTFDGNRNFFWGTPISGDCTTLGNDPLCFVPSVNPAAEIGAGVRVFFFKWLAVRLEVRDFTYFHNRGANGLAIQNMALVNLGLSIWFPLGFDYEYQ